jgi:hypothetical protein
MKMDWIAVGVIISGLAASTALIGRFFDMSVSLREHEEYKGQQKSQDELRDKAVELQTENLLRDIVRIEHRLDMLEATRPTAGQLQDATANLKERLLDKMIR